LLKPGIALPMGKFTATGNHLSADSKIPQGSTWVTIKRYQSQNFQAVVNITATSHLLSKIPGGNATKCYVNQSSVLWMGI